MISSWRPQVTTPGIAERCRRWTRRTVDAGDSRRRLRGQLGRRDQRTQVQVGVPPTLGAVPKYARWTRVGDVKSSCPSTPRRFIRRSLRARWRIRCAPHCRRVRPFSTRRPRLTRRPTRWRQLVLAPEDDARIRPEQVAQQVAPCATRSQACEIIRKDWRRRPDLNRGWSFCRPLAKPRSQGKRSSRKPRSRRHLGFVNLMDALKKSLDAVSTT